MEESGLPREKGLQFVQTEPVNFSEEPLEEIKKPYMLDE